jgi:hypothetical protein
MTVTTGRETSSYQDLLAYWCGELPADREREIEERLFEDDESARRLESIVRLGHGVRELMRTGRLASAATVKLVDRLRDAGVTLRSYRIGPGEVVPCTIGSEDFVVVRLHGVFDGLHEVELEMRAELAGEPRPTERISVPVDQAHAEVVLLYPGDQIRALPRSKFAYHVTSSGPEGSPARATFHLDHTPPS